MLGVRRIDEGGFRKQIVDRVDRHELGGGFQRQKNGRQDGGRQQQRRPDASKFTKSVAGQSEGGSNKEKEFQPVHTIAPPGADDLSAG